MRNSVALVAVAALAASFADGATFNCPSPASCTGQTFASGDASIALVATAPDAAASARLELNPPSGGSTIAQVDCAADDSCRSLQVLANGPYTAAPNVAVGCDGMTACRTATFQLHEYESATISCSQPHSCQGATVSVRQGALPAELQCTGHLACDLTNLLVGSDAAAIVDCGGINAASACSGLSVQCLGTITSLQIVCPDTAPGVCSSVTLQLHCSSTVNAHKVEYCLKARNGGLNCSPAFAPGTTTPPAATTALATTQATAAATTTALPPVTTTPQPVCNDLSSEWLETEFMPALDTTLSGFHAKDEFRISFDYHRKYFDVVPTLNALPSEVVDVAEHQSSTGQSSPECWDHYCITATWADVVANDNCHRESDAVSGGFITFTCKLRIDARETLDPIRSVQMSREIHNELPFQVLFPKQTSASIGDISAFQPADVQAAIVRQEVDVNVNGLDVDVTVDLYTSIQWPFLLTTPQVGSTPLQIAAGDFTLHSPCADPDAGDQPGAGLDANACNQIWRLKLDPFNGARSEPCQLDGDYSVNFKAECQASFPSDCPLVKDDLDQVSDTFVVNFVLDSEYFCPTVVETVDLAAELHVYKDHIHAVPATNFIIGQRAYFRFIASSTEVTIASVTLDDIEVDGCDAVAGEVYTDKVFPVGALFAETLVGIENSGSATTAGNVPQDEAWFDFPISNPPFGAPVDGSCDFSVSVTADVQFKDAAAVVLLGEKAPWRRSRHRFTLLQDSSARQQVASTSFVASEYDREASSAPTVAASVAGALASGVAAAVVFA